MRRLTLAAILFAFIAALSAFSCAGVRAQQTDASPAPTDTHPPIPSPKPTADDPKIHKFAVQQFLAWQTGDVNRDLYSDRVNGQMTEELMDRGTKTLANLGALQQAQFQGISAAQGATFYVYKMTCQRGTINMDFSLDPDGKIGLIYFE
jgi:hypothetical protein